MNATSTWSLHLPSLRVRPLPGRPLLVVCTAPNRDDATSRPRIRRHPRKARGLLSRNFRPSTSTYPHLIYSNSSSFTPNPGHGRVSLMISSAEAPKPEALRSFWDHTKLALELAIDTVHLGRFEGRP